MKFTPLFLVICILSGSLNAQEADTTTQKLTTAVLDFDGLGITSMEAVALTQRLSGEMVNTNVFILVNRSQMKEILQEQGFQQSGCTTAECAVEIGNLLGVQQMVSGSFGKIGETYTIETKLFSVETGETIRALNKTYKGAVDGLITQVELVAWELAGLEPPDELKQKAGMEVEKPKVAKKKKGGVGRFLFWTTALAAAGGGAYYYLYLMESKEGDLSLPPDPPPSPKLLFGGGR